jgi:hypothetical protein
VVQEKMDDYGGILWCAAETQCTNTLKAASSDINCSQCHNNVHNDCCDYVEEKNIIYIYCAKCLHKKKEVVEQVQEGQTNLAEHKIGQDISNHSKKHTDINNYPNCKYDSKSWCAAKTKCQNQQEM